ncbi:MAG: hypothetical protein EPN91_00220, partial [Salinibacterium sp.]
MSASSWPTRFLKPVGTRAYLRIYWGGPAEYVVAGEAADPCPNGYGKGHVGIHNAQVHLMDSPVCNDWELGGSASEYDESRWPTTCDHCPAQAPPQTVHKRCCAAPDCTQTRPVVMRQVFRRTLYEVQGESPPVQRIRAELEIGDMYYATWFDCEQRAGNCHHGWINCDGKHLMVVLPNGREWDVSGRASNCTLKDDNVHRCWVRHGDPESGNVHVDKAGLTCSAGAGSIQ